MTLPSAHELFSNAGGYETAFKKGTPIGTVVSGEVTNVEALQVKNYDTEELEWWEPDRPKMQMRIVVNTGVLDPMVENDTGERAIYIKWWGDNRTALMDAVKAAGAKSVEVGGMFAAKLMGTKPTEGKNGKPLNDSKIFGYQYKPPVQGVDFGQMGEPAAPAQQAPVQQQMQQPPAQPQGAGEWGTPAQLGGLPAAPTMAPTQQAAPPVQQAPQTDQWGNQAGQQWGTPAPQQTAPPAPPAPPVTDQAAMQNMAQGLAAAPIQQQAAPPAPPADDPVAKAQQLIQLGFTNEQIAAATGGSPEQIQALRG